jgi:hypothetical protein
VTSVESATDWCLVSDEFESHTKLSCALCSVMLCRSVNFLFINCMV